MNQVFILYACSCILIAMCFLRGIELVGFCNYYGPIENIVWFGWISRLGVSDSFRLDHRCVIEVDTECGSYGCGQCFRCCALGALCSSLIRLRNPMVDHCCTNIFPSTMRRCELISPLARLSSYISYIYQFAKTHHQYLPLNQQLLLY